MGGDIVVRCLDLRLHRFGFSGVWIIRSRVPSECLCRHRKILFNTRVVATFEVAAGEHQVVASLDQECASLRLGIRAGLGMSSYWSGEEHKAADKNDRDVFHKGLERRPRTGHAKAIIQDDQTGRSVQDAHELSDDLILFAILVQIP